MRMGTQPRAQDRDDVVEARKIWAETRDPAATFAAMPGHCNLERSVLRALAQNPLFVRSRTTLLHPTPVAGLASTLTASAWGVCVCI